MSKKIKSTEIKNNPAAAEAVGAAVVAKATASKKVAKDRLLDKDERESDEVVLSEEGLQAEQAALVDVPLETASSEGVLLAAADVYAIEGSLLSADISAGFDLASAAGAASTTGGASTAAASTSFWSTGWGIAAGVAGAVGAAAAVNALRDDKPKSTVTTEQSDSGVVVDGYLYGATVRRANGSGNTVTTDENGAFKGLTGTGDIVVTGGTDVLSGQPFTGRLVAPDDSAIITPLTTLVVKLAEQMKAADSSLSSEQAQEAAVAKVNAFAGVTDPNFDLLNVDPLAGSSAGGDAMIALKAGIQVATVLQAMTGTVAGYQDAAEALAAKMLTNDVASKVATTADLAIVAKLDAIVAEIPLASRNAATENNTPLLDTAALATSAGVIVHSGTSLTQAVTHQQTALQTQLGAEKMPISPTVTITDDQSGTVKAGDTVVFTFKFDEAVTGFDDSKVTVTNGTIRTFTPVSATEYTLAVTLSATGTGNIQVSVLSTGVVNGEGKTVVPSGHFQAYDTVAPTVVITDDKSVAANGDVTFTYTFSEAVTGFTADKITVTGGNKGAFSGSGAVYTLVVTPTANSTTPIELTTSTAGVIDAAGNVATAPEAYTQAVDTVVPTVTITDSVANTATGDVTFTYTFSEAVTGFTADKITVTGGNKGAFSGSGAVYTLVVTPTANSTTPISLTTSTTGVTDATGNDATAPAVYNQAVDTVAPTLSITDSASGSAGGPVTFTYTFSEAVTGFTAEKITVAGGTKGTFTAVSATEYTLVVTPPANSTGSLVLTTSVSGVVDANSNAAAALDPAVGTYSQVFNTNGVSVTITDNKDGTLKAGETVTYTFTFSEAVTGFDASKVNVTNGSKGTFTAVNGAEYTLVVTPATNSAANIQVSTSSVGVTAPSSGLPVTEGSHSTQAVDTVVPTVTITDSVANTATGDVTFTYTFSEAVTGFTADKITVTGGNKGAFSGSGAVYTLVVTPTANSTTPISLTTSTTGVTDATGNDATAPAVYNQAVDTVAPTLSITDSASGSAGGPVTFTYTFSEAVTGFTAEKITVAGGTKGTFTAVSATEYTLVVTPPANSTGSLVLTTSVSGVVDANSNAAAALDPAVGTYSQVFNTNGVSVTITDNKDGTLKAGETVTYTFTFSEAVTGFDASKVNVTNGSKGTFTAVNGAEYTLVVTPATNSAANIQVSTSSVGVTAPSSGLPVTEGSHSTQAVDTVVPTVTITDSVANTATGDVTFTYTFSEAVTGFTADKITVTGGNKGAFSGSGAVYTLVVTPTANSTTPISLTTSTTGVTDATGNDATAPAVYNQAVDTVAPTLSITDSASGSAGGPVTFTYTFSEAVTGFTAEKITVAGGTKGTFTAVSATEYTLVVTPPANSTGSLVLTTSVSGVVDANGNAAAALDPAVGTYSQVFNTNGVSVTITDNKDGTLKAGETVTYTFTFSEAVTGFDASKVNVTNGSKGSFAATSATVYTLVVTPATSSTSSMEVSTVATGVTATSGATVLTGSSVQAVDTVVPTVTITDSAANTATGAVTFTYTFSEAVTGFDTNKITVTGGTKGTFTPVSSTVYTLVVTPTANSTTPIGLTTSTTGVIDAAGNVVPAPAVYNQAVDTVVPTVTITDSAANTATGAVTFTYTFSEAVTGFDTNKITVTGGTKGTFTPVSSTVYTLVVTPTANSTTPIGLTTSTTGVIDAAGNVVPAPAVYNQAVDTVVPTVTITDSAANTATGAVTFTYTFSEAVTGFDTNKITVTGGTKGTFTPVSSTVYTLVVTPTANSTTPIGLTTSTTGVIDAAGNVVPAPAVYNQAVDTVVPTVTITDSAANTATGAVTFTYTFSEAVTGFDTNKITVTGGTKGTFTPVSSTVYTLVVTPTANSTTPIGLTTSTTGVIDAAGNVVPAPAVYNQAVDTVVPTVTITDSAANTATGAVTFTYTFSEAVTGFDTNKITVTGGTKGTFTPVSSTVYTLVVTPTANSTTPIGLTTSTTGVIDAAGNVVPAPAVYNQAVDTVVPTVTITDSAANTATGAVTFTYTFSEAVTGFDTNKITVTGGTKGTFTPVSSTVYTLVVTPTANSTTPIGLTTSTTGVIDAAGNVVPAPAVYNQAVDTVVPTVTITDSAANTATGAVTFTYTFSEAVTGFDTNKITVTGGTKGTFTPVSSTVYTLVVTPTANSTTPIGLTTSTTGVIDAAGNVVPAPAVYNQAVDTVVPTVTITDSAANTATGAVTFTYTFSEAVTGFDTNKITVTGGTKGTFTPVSSTVYTLVVTPTANSTTPIGLTTSTTGVIDAAGNVVPAPAVYNQAVDTVVPTVTITDSAANTATGAVTFTYTFSEAVTGFDTNKITVTGGTKGTFTPVSSTVYTLVVTPTANSTTPIGLTTSTTGVIDAAGNVVPAPAVYNQAVDTVVPTVTITDSAANTATGAVTFTYTFSEAVTGFDTNKITVTGGTKGTFTPVSSTVYTLVVTPTANSTTPIGLTTSTTGVIDAAGNVVPAPAVYNQAVDTVVPTVTITDSAANTATGAVTFTYTFSEAVTGFDTNKITVTGGTKGTFTPVSSTVYTLVVTPTANSTTPIGLTTSTTGVIDAAGNVVPAPAVYNQAVDTVVPTVTITDSAANTATGAVTFTYTFSEAVTGFDTNKITVTGGTKGTFTPVSSTVYTLVVTPTANSTTPIGLTTSTTGVIDAAGNVVPAPAVYNQAVDTVVPTVTITDSAANTATGAVTFTYTFSEAVTGFDTNKITVTGGTKGTFTPVSSTVYTLVVTPTANSTTPIGLTTSTTGVIDAAGNVVPAPAVYSQAVDTAAPSISSSTLPRTTLINGGDGIGDTVVLTVTFDEVVEGLTTGTNDTVFRVGGAGVIANWAGVSGTSTRTLTYTVAIGQNGALTLDETALKTALAGITDIAGNTFSYTANGGVIANIDATPLPTIDSTVATFTNVTISGVNSNNVPKSGNLSAGDKISVQLFASEVLVVTGNPTFTIDVGGVSKQATYSAGSGSNRLTFYYVIGAEDVDSSGGITSSAATALSLAGGTILDNAGNVANLSTVPAVVDGSNAVSIILDNTAPTVSSLNITSATGRQNNLLNVGDEVMVTAVFSENVVVTGFPQIALTIGATTVQASYVSGSGSSSLVFKYTIVVGDTDANGIAIPANALTLNSGTIKDIAGNNATLAGLVGQVDNSAYRVDTTVPTFTTTVVAGVDSLNVSKSSTLQIGDKVRVTLSSLDALVVSGVPTLSIDVGGVTKQALYGSGSGTTSLIFYYTVSQGDLDSTGGITVATNALTIPAGAFITDLAGNAVVTTIAAVVAGANTIAVDAVGAPSTSVASLTLSEDTGASSTDFVTKTAAQTISGTLSAGLAAGETVKISFDNGATWSAVSTQPAIGATGFSHTATLSGSNTMLVRIENSTKVGASYSQAYMLDTSVGAPIFLLQSVSDTGLYNNDFVTNQTLLTFDVVGERGSVVTVFADTNNNNIVDVGESLGSTTLTSTVGVVSLASPLAAGVYSNFKAIQTDVAGNISDASAAHSSITINTSAAVSIDSVASVTLPVYATYKLDLSAGVTSENLDQGSVDNFKTSGFDSTLNDGGNPRSSTNASGDKWNISSYVESTGLNLAEFISNVKMVESSLAGQYAGFGLGVSGITDKTAYVSFSGIQNGSTAWFSVIDDSYLKGYRLLFSIEQVNGVDQLMLRNADDAYQTSFNLYDPGLAVSTKTSSSYSAGNIAIYYTKEVQDAVVTKPSFMVSYEGTPAKVGDQIQLYEGESLLGAYTLMSSDVGVGTKSVLISSSTSMSVGSHNLSFKYVDLAGNSTTFGSQQTVNIESSTVAAPTLSITSLIADKEGQQSIRAITDFSQYQSTVDPDLTFEGSVDQDSLISVYANNKLVYSKLVTAGAFDLSLQSYALAPGVYNFVIEATNPNSGKSSIFSTTKGIGVFAGYSGADTIIGTSNSDMISAGDGINTVTTGAGNDVVFISAIDPRSTGSKGTTITDFLVGSDLIDVTGFLGTNVNSSTLSSFVTSQVTGGNTVLTFDSNGTAVGGGNIHVVTLQGVTGIAIDDNLIRYTVI